MKDDLVERCWTRLVGKRTTREQCNVVTIDRDDLTAILAIARPAILEEEAAEIANSPYGMARHELSRRVRALAHANGQEGGR